MPSNVIGHELRDEMIAVVVLRLVALVTARCPAGTNGVSSNSGRNSFSTNRSELPISTEAGASDFGANHLGQIDQRLDRRMQEVSPRRFANIDGEISDTLQVGVDFERRHDGPQVAGDGLWSISANRVRPLDDRVALSVAIV